MLICFDCVDDHQETNMSNGGRCVTMFSIENWYF
jgi:hypothetical protein